MTERNLDDSNSDRRNYNSDDIVINSKDTNFDKTESLSNDSNSEERNCIYMNIDNMVDSSKDCSSDKTDCNSVASNFNDNSSDASKLRERDSNRIYWSNSEQLNSDNIDINSMGGNSYTTDSNLDKSNSNENISDVSNLGDSDSNHLCQSNPNKTNSKLNASYSSNSVSGSSNLGDSDSNHSVHSYQSEEEDSQQISDTGGLEENINIQFKEYREGLSIYYTNADSVLNKLDELKVRIQIISPDILIITEIFPKTGKACDIAVEELHIDNYTLYTSSIKDNSRGVATYVVNSLSSTLNLNLTSGEELYKYSCFRSDPVICRLQCILMLSYLFKK